MSNLSPFDSSSGIEPASQTEYIQVFKPDLSGVDWDAYDERQAILDSNRSNGDVADAMVRIHTTSKQGLKLNNLHGHIIEGNLPKGLEAPLTVWTNSRLGANLISANMHGSVGNYLQVERGRSVEYSDFTDSVYPNLDLRGVDASGVNFGNSVLTGLLVDSDTVLAGTSFRNTFLIDAEGFVEEHTRDADFRGSFVLGAVAPEVLSLYEQLSLGFDNPDDASKFLRTAREIPSGSRAPRISSGVDLRALYAENFRGDGAQLTERNFVGSKLIKPDVRNSTLASSAMSGVVVIDGTFDGTDMHGVWAPGITVQEVSVRGVNVSGSNVVGSVWRGIDMRKLIGLESANTNGMVVEDCILPSGFSVENGNLIFDGPNTIAGNENEQPGLPEQTS